VNLRVTKEQGRLSEKDIRELIEKYSQADFFICGPDIYQDTVALYLRNCQVNEHSIHVETFNSPATDKVEVELNSRTYLYFGLALFAAFFLQHIFNLKLGWLENWQTRETFKMWSGLAVTLYLLAQWYFPTLRLRKKSLEASKQYTIHKQIGALGPLLYYFHSTKLGFGFLFMLSTFFFANNLLGLINHDLVKTPEKRRRYSYFWLAPHIVLSLLIMALTIYHIAIVFFYE
jgi:predicted ferric reductase